MKTMRNTLICLALTLLSVPVVHAQDLSKYRQFSLGASLAEVSKEIDQRPGEASVIQQSPAAIQQMEWWPVALNVLTKSEPVQKVTFSFYNHTLYKIAVTYDDDATAGLTVSDMLRAISASYGPVTGAATETDSHSNTTYGATETVGQWEDAKYSITLLRESVLNAFQLVVLTKQLNAEAEASIVEAAEQNRADAPQREIARGKKAADDLETQRQANLKAFRP
jgi:hypothetical protein